MQFPSDKRGTEPLGRRSALGLLGAAALAGPAVAARTAVRMAVPAMAEVVDPGTLPLPMFQTGMWCEGPVWAPGLGGLVFSDTKRNRISVLGPAGRATALRDPSNNSNGNALDGQGRLLSCEHRSRQVVRREADGSITVLADRYRGKRLNSPNDLAVAADGAIWFTDPTFGLREPDEGIEAPPELPGRFVFRLDPSGRLDVAADGLEQPNGIVFSPDGKRLFVSDTGAALNPEGTRDIRVFDVDGTRLRNERLFARLDDGVPDGLTVDADGRLYAATGEGVRVWTAEGAGLGLIATPSPAGNLCFGGDGGRTLFVCCGNAILTIETKVRGAHEGG